MAANKKRAGRPAARPGKAAPSAKSAGRPSRASRPSGPPPKKARKVTASDGSTWVVKRVGDLEIIQIKTHEATRKPRFKRADFVWNPFYRSFKKNKKPAS